MMSELPQGDPARQAELFQSAKDAAAVSPTTSNRLKYALALATPGHSGSDPVAAQRQLSELLARPETLLTAERLLALVELQEVDQRLVLQAENQRLRSDDAAHDSRDKLQAVNRRLRRSWMKMRDCARRWTRHERSSMRSRTSSDPSMIAAPASRTPLNEVTGEIP